MVDGCGGTGSRSGRGGTAAGGDSGDTWPPVCAEDTGKAEDATGREPGSWAHWPGSAPVLVLWLVPELEEPVRGGAFMGMGGGDMEPVKGGWGTEPVGGAVGAAPLPGCGGAAPVPGCGAPWGGALYDGGWWGGGGVASTPGIGTPPTADRDAETEDDKDEDAEGGGGDPAGGGEAGAE